MHIVLFLAYSSRVPPLLSLLPLRRYSYLDDDVNNDIAWNSLPLRFYPIVWGLCLIGDEARQGVRYGGMSQRNYLSLPGALYNKGWLGIETFSSSPLTFSLSSILHPRHIISLTSHE